MMRDNNQDEKYIKIQFKDKEYWLINIDEYFNEEKKTQFLKLLYQDPYFSL